MPAICESISTKLTENLSQSFKKTEKENFDFHLTPTAKQVLSAKIEYEPVASYSNSILSSLQTKYIVLKPNQSALSSNGNSQKSQQNNVNGKHSGTSTSSQIQLPSPKKVLFPREKVQVGWGVYERQWHAGSGFNNIGNTCYLNSALQAFFHVPAIANWLNSDKEHRDKCSQHSGINCIICAMAQTLLNTQKPHSTTPSLITNRLQSICRHMHIGRQEDAHEFLRYLIEQMEKAYLLRFKNTQGFKEMEQYSKETTPLNQILGGYLRSTVTCMSCKHESITFEHFMDMALDISRFSMLNDALSGYFTRENLEECGYKCESCKKKVSATKQFSLERAPVVLCIQLKRFNVSGGKLGKQIQISQYLDLTKYLAKASEPNQNCQYKLTSMVTHLGGSASGGHYTAIGQGPNGNFYQFDDSCVSMISSEQVMRTNSYVLFYELDKRKMQNGHGSLSHIHQNEHTYSKSASSTSTSSSFNSIDRSFAKPKLPSQMIPTSIMRQNNYLKQKENETTPPTSRNGIGNGPSTSKMANGNSKVSTQLFPAVKPNGKREAGSESDGDEVAAKRIKPSLPSLPRLTNEEQQVSPKVSTSPVPANEVTTPIKPKSLVPYETDDEDEELPPTNGVANGHKKAEAVKLCRTSSGVFVETDWKENNTPSKQGSTIDKTVVTKASQLTNGNGVHPAVNGKTPSTNGFHIIRSDDTIQQLTKLNHSGYGSSEVVSWNNTPTNMNREVDKDQSEDRKRQHEDDDDMEMDAGRVKKIKVRQNYPQSGGKLPNPFQEQQNSQNHNGNFRPPNKYYESPPNGFRNRFQNGNNNYNNSRNFKSGHNGNGNSNGNGNNYSNPKFHPKYGNGKFQNHNGNNKRYFNNHRR